MKPDPRRRTLKRRARAATLEHSLATWARMGSAPGVAEASLAARGELAQLRLDSHGIALRDRRSWLPIVDVVFADRRAA